MGDFNAPARGRRRPGPAGRHAEPRVIAQMESRLCDAYRLYGEPGSQSFIPSTDPPIRIDYIFASQPLADGVRSCTIWREPAGREASDHRPVLAEVELPAAA